MVCQVLFKKSDVLFSEDAASYLISRLSRPSTFSDSFQPRHH